MRLRPLVLAAALAVPFATAAAQDAPAAARPDSLGLARKYVAWFYAAEVDSLWAHTAQGFRENIGTADWWRQRADQFAMRAGTETEVMEERFRMRNGRPQYWRTARFSDFGEPLLLRFVIDDAGLISGLGMGPLSQAPPTDD
jgi:hypothetical protein